MSKLRHVAVPDSEAEGALVIDRYIMIIPGCKVIRIGHLRPRGAGDMSRGRGSWQEALEVVAQFRERQRREKRREHISFK